jgi:hypothetical protein
MQDPIQSRIHNGHQALMPNPTSHLSQPIYFLPGPPYPPAMRHPQYIENTESPMPTFSTYIQPRPVFQPGRDDMGCIDLPMQSVRPVSSSSSESPDEIILTPYMVQGSQSFNATPYMHYIQADPAYTPSAIPMPMGAPVDGANGMYASSSTVRTSSTSIQNLQEPYAKENPKPTTERSIPPSLRRRHTDSLPFSEGPLKHPTRVPVKPYDNASDRLRRPISAMDYPLNSLGTGFLELDNNYVAKQRIACQGCRGMCG